jgi:hypothetical protein
MKLTKSTVTFVGCCSLIALLTGCASVLCGSQQKVALDSHPTGAEVLVYDSRGEIVFQKTTPCVAYLDRRERDNMESAKYTVLLKKDGFAPTQFPLNGIINRAYFANVLTGGIGFVVDPMLGAMWTLTPSTTETDLVSQQVGFFSQDGLMVSLKEEPAQEESKPFLKAAKD